MCKSPSSDLIWRPNLVARYAELLVMTVLEAGYLHAIPKPDRTHVILLPLCTVTVYSMLLTRFGKSERRNIGDCDVTALPQLT